MAWRAPPTKSPAASGWSAAEHSGAASDARLCKRGPLRAFVGPEATSGLTPRDGATGRLKWLVRPVYVSTALTRRTGVTMGYLTYKRWAWRKWGGGWPESVVLAAYRHDVANRAEARSKEQAERARWAISPPAITPARPLPPAQVPL
jgi:hypothetical protein